MSLPQKPLRKTVTFEGEKKEESDSYYDSTPPKPKPKRPPLDKLEEGDRILGVEKVFWNTYHKVSVAKVKMETLNGKISKRINLARFRGTKADPWLEFMAGL